MRNRSRRSGIDGRLHPVQRDRSHPMVEPQDGPAFLRNRRRSQRTQVWDGDSGPPVPLVSTIDYFGGIALALEPVG